MRYPGRVWAALAVMTAAGAALRLYGLDRESLWTDELSSWADYHLPNWWKMVFERTPQDHAPGYWLLMYLWVRICGDSETMLRLPAALAGIATIPAMFVLGSRLYGWREGLLAAGLTASLRTPIHYSQEARPYAFLILTVVLSSIWLVDITRALRAQHAPPRHALVGYVIAAAASCYLHYFGLLFTVLQAVLVVLLLARQAAARRQLAFIYGIILAAYLPWLGRALVAHAPAWIRAPTPRSLVGFVGWLFNESVVLAGLAVTAWAAVLAGVLVRMRRTRTQSAPASGAATDLLLIAWLVVPVAIAYLRSLLIEPTFGYRYLLVVAPAAYLLVARAIVQSPIPFGARPALAVAVSALLIAHLIFVQRYFSTVSKEQFREAAAYLVEHDTPERPALVLSPVTNHNYFDYYLTRLGSARRIDRLASRDNLQPQIAQLLATRSPEIVWLLAAHHKAPPELVAWLSEQFQLVGTAELQGAGAWHFAKRDQR